MIDRHNRIHVVNDTPCIRREHRRIDLPARGGKNQLPLRTLRIFCFQRFYCDLALLLCQARQQLDTIRFVVLHCKNPLCIVKQTQDNLHTVNQLLRFLQHSAVIRSQIRFALRTVCNHILYFFRLFGRELHMGREPCTAHTYHACLLDQLQNFFFI